MKDTKVEQARIRIDAARKHLTDALEVKEWHYNYRSPYTGAPVWVWYIDNRGCEVKRPYDG